MPTKFLFLIQPHTNLLDLGGATQTFLEAQQNGLDIEMDYCTYGDSIISSVGLPFGKIKNYTEVNLNAGDYIFVLSTNIDFILSKECDLPNQFLHWLKLNYENKVNICAICNGAFLLGKAGLLNNNKCTTHWKRTKELQHQNPLALVQENIIYVEDNGIITSAGGTSGVDVSLHILNKLKGDYFTHKISRELIVYQRRNGSDAQESVFVQYRRHVHVGIHAVQDFIHNNLHKKNSLQNLAEMANMSYRNFSRIFKKETGVTALEYINKLRIERIQQLLQNPNLSRKQIAQKVGLESERHLSRLVNLS